MYLNKSSFTNEKFNEISSLPRFVASQEDIEFVELHEAEKLSSMKKSPSHTTKIASQNDALNIPQPTTLDECIMKANEKSDRYKKRIAIMIENEIAKKLAYNKINLMSSIKDTQAKFPVLHKQ